MVATLRHPNVVLFLAYSSVPPCVVTEYCSRGSFYDVIRAARSCPEIASTLPWPRRLGMVRGVA
jgi:hypothetical protein